MTDIVRQIFETGPQRGCAPKWDWVRKKIAIRILDHRYEASWVSSDFWRNCVEAGINIGFVREAVVLQNHQTHEVSGRPYMVQTEMKFRFYQPFWERAIKWEPQGAAVALSHLRGMADGVEVAGERGWVLMLERDVIMSPNSFHQLVWLLKSLYMEARFRDLFFISMCFSTDRQDHLATIMEQVRAEPPSQSNQWHYQVLPHPTEQRGDRQQFTTLSNIGQGCRAYLIKTEFARFLDSILVWQWIDVFIRAEAANYASRIAQGDELLVGVCFPSLVTHPVSRSSVTRGSGRVAALISAPEMVMRPYITLALDREWGLSNRAGTIVCLLAWANAMGYGIHIYWKLNDACNTEFQEMFTLTPKLEQLPGIAYVMVHHDRAKFAPYLSNALDLNKGNYRFQCMPRQFLSEMVANLPPHRQNLNEVWTHTTTEDAFVPAWAALKPRQQLVDDVDGFMDRWPEGTEHAALHLRRGDFKAFMVADARKQGGAQVARVASMFRTADEQVKEYRGQHSGRFLCGDSNTIGFR
jgi:hypothetical protein